ncbi:MAG: acylase [Halieaceae bacterium]|jgi:acyl-homoserine-lactone acylase|nr:acylase [Halieaceae bacterium]
MYHRLTMTIIALGGFLALGACNHTADPGAAAASGKYATDIRWTSYGIPHVKAADWGSLGYGFAYATAQDAVCVIAKELVLMDGEMSRYFGTNDKNRADDIFHKVLLQPQRLTAYGASQSDGAMEFSDGYIAGYNRFLRDNRGQLPASCNDVPWVRQMVADDVAKLSIGVGIRYGLGRLSQEMAAAAPPQPGEVSTALLDTDFDAPRGYGSNAVALGRAVTDSGRGILFGNPHYPWSGPSRFHLIHTTIPGELDVMGVSLLSTSRIVIGFNSDVAWSHTVSTALRATLYQLQLNPQNPLQYRYGDGYRDIEARQVSVASIADNGELTHSQHTVYFSHFGPLVESKALPWNATIAYAIRDANLENTRTADTYDALNKARNTAEVEAAISRQGVSWTNTVAADKEGNAFYADISVTPNVDAELLTRCQLKPEAVPARAIVLDGSRAECEWRNDARSAIPGVLPAQEMPRLHRDDYVANSNNSYWLSNPQQPLEGYSPIIGDERTARSLRTRAGLTFIGEKLNGGRKMTPADMQAMIYTHRNYGAELLLDDLLVLCSQQQTSVVLEEASVDIAPSCNTLRGWDRRNTVDSRGGHLWREFWRGARQLDNVFATPFDANDPVHTPNGLAITEAQVREGLLQALAQAQHTLQQANIALDAPLGEIQYTEINGQRVAIPGGEGWAGMWSMIIAQLEKDTGYSPIIHGNSFMQVISWDEQGKVNPRGILAYSQSPEPDSPHSMDMTRLYSSGEWIDLPFTEAEINTDPNLVSLTLSE